MKVGYKHKRSVRSVVYLYSSIIRQIIPFRKPNTVYLGTYSFEKNSSRKRRRLKELQLLRTSIQKWTRSDITQK